MLPLSWLIENNKLQYGQIKSILENENSWWVKKTVVKYIDIELYGEPSYVDIMKKLIVQDNNTDIAMNSAHEIIKNKCKLNPPYTKIHHMAQKQLKFAGLINRAGSRPSRIGQCLNRICDRDITETRWKFIFRKEHELAENIMINALAYSKTDVSAFVNILDTFNDLLLSRLHLHDKKIGNHVLGNFGSIYNNKKLIIKYPMFHNYCKEIHETRLECFLSHAITKSSRKSTKRIEYKYMKTAKNLIYEGIEELIRKW